MCTKGLQVVQLAIAGPCDLAKSCKLKGTPRAVDGGNPEVLLFLGIILFFWDVK